MADDGERPPSKRSKKTSQVVFGSTGMGVGPAQDTESELMAGSLDLFSKPPTEDTMLYNREAIYYPVGQLTDQGPYQFRIPSENGLERDSLNLFLISVF